MKYQAVIIRLICHLDKDISRYFVQIKNIELACNGSLEPACAELITKTLKISFTTFSLILGVDN